MPDVLTDRSSLLRHPAAQYGFALAMLALSTAIRWSFNPLLGDRLPYLFYFVVVVVISLSCDLGPAVFAMLGTTLAANYLFLSPYHGFTLTPQALIFGALYLASGSTIVY